MDAKAGSIEYVLVTPARNEQKNMPRLIESVVSQKHLPMRWVIVNDASTDSTEAIARNYLESNPWIELVNMPEERDRSFAAKVDCFNAGYERVKGLDYEIIGNLDADISFEDDYLEFLMRKFVEMPDLGVAGTPFVEDDGYSSISDSCEGSKHVAGGCQLFRRRCFDEIGGYIPNRAGGIDWIAVTTARMKGWHTQSFPEKVFYHHRSLGTGESNKMISNFNYGRKDYYLGNHPLWETIRVLYRFTKRPFLIGGLITMSGYLTAVLTRMDRPISNELMSFHRDEQIRKLKAVFVSLIKNRKIDKYSLKY